MAIIILPHHENTVAYGINIHACTVGCIKFILVSCKHVFLNVACNYFMLKADVIMLLTMFQLSL